MGERHEASSRPCNQQRRGPWSATPKYSACQNVKQNAAGLPAAPYVAEVRSVSCSWPLASMDGVSVCQSTVSIEGRGWGMLKRASILASVCNVDVQDASDMQHMTHGILRLLTTTCCARRTSAHMT